MDKTHGESFKEFMEQHPEGRKQEGDNRAEGEAMTEQRETKNMAEIGA